MGKFQSRDKIPKSESTAWASPF